MRRLLALFLLCFAFLPFFSLAQETIQFSWNWDQRTDATGIIIHSDDYTHWPKIVYDIKKHKIISYNGDLPDVEKHELIIRQGLEELAKLAEEVKKGGERIESYVFRSGRDFFGELSIHTDEPLRRFHWKVREIPLPSSDTSPVAARVAAEIFKEQKHDDLKSLDSRYPSRNALIGLKYGDLDYAVKELQRHQLGLRNRVFKELRHSQNVSAELARAIKANQLLTEIAIKRGVPRNSFTHYNFLESVSLPSNVKVVPSVRSDIRTLGEESFIETFQRQLRKGAAQKRGGLAPK